VRRTPLGAAALLAAGALGALVGHGTQAALTSSTGAPGNVVSAGTVTLSDDDGGAATVSVAGGRPGDVVTGCVRVTSQGTLPTGAVLYGTATGGLAAHITLRVTRGTQPDGATGCTGFTADAADHVGAGAGVVYDGPLTALPATAAAGVALPGVWSAGATHAYRVRVALGIDPAAQGLTATATLRWRASS